MRSANDDPTAGVARLDADQRRARRASVRRRRAAVRRRRAVALAALLLAALVTLWLSVGSATPPRHAASTGARTVTVRATASDVAVQHTRPAAQSPGSLPQTNAFPSGTSAHFKALMASLWAGVVSDSVTRALPAFFPEGAYLQLKSIASASSDWTNRLVRDYSLDLASAHALLGSDAASARLINVEVPESYGHWIVPGVCDNGIGYYEMPNARVIYSEHGQVRSFGIASMISWRGVWYVVHFGAILRSSDSGAVDDPASGPGTSAYSGTC